MRSPRLAGAGFFPLGGPKLAGVEGALDATSGGVGLEAYLEGDTLDRRYLGCFSVFFSTGGSDQKATKHSVPDAFLYTANPSR